MSLPGDVEVLVVGAGPAGLATAIELANLDIRAVVIDRSGPGIDKPCGEGLMPDGVRRLESLGVRLPPDRRATFYGIRYIDGDLSAEARFRGGVGWGVRRPELHRALVDRAQEKGVVLLWNTTVEALGDRSVDTSRGPVRARWIVGADGLRSKVRRWAQLDAGTRRRARFGARRHYAIPPWSDRVEVYWSDSCEAYVTPVSQQEVGVAVLWGGYKASFDDHLGRFPRLMERLEGAAVTSSDRGTGPLDQRVKRVAEGRLALVGDAAGYRDAITGEGISVALHQASALAEAIQVSDMAQYQRAVRRLTVLPFALIRGLLIAERRPWLRRRLIKTLARDPALFGRLLAIHARELPPRDLGAGGLARLARGLLTG